MCSKWVFIALEWLNGVCGWAACGGSSCSLVTSTAAAICRTPVALLFTGSPGRTVVDGSPRTDLAGLCLACSHVG